MKSNIDLILIFLEDKPGYSKEGANRLSKHIFKQTGEDFCTNDCKTALKIFRKRIETKNKFEGTSKRKIKLIDSDIPKGFQIKSKWQNASGEWLMSLKPISDNENSNKIEDFRAEMIKDLKDYSPSIIDIKREHSKDPNMLVIDIADLHIGKLSSDSETGESYNVNIAVERALEAVDSILKKASGFFIDKILLPIGNDILHIDTPGRTTTSGTSQDTDGMWYDNFIIARKLYVKIIEVLVQKADVHVIHCPSNHDYMSGFMLADAVYCWFNKSENITFDTSISHRKYFRYGNNLIGLSHGDGAKPVDMPLLMANESKLDWATTEYKYIYLHHIHHKNVVKFQSAKDYMGVTLEYLRSPSSPDSWHSRNGFCHSQKAIEAFIHNFDKGQVARITHNFK